VPRSWTWIRILAVVYVMALAPRASLSLTNLQVNDPGLVQAGSTDVTPSVAAIGNKVLIVWWVRGSAATQRLQAAVSEDGGTTYADVSWLPALNGDWRWGADPVVQSDPVTNTFFVASQSTSNLTHEAGIAFVTATISSGIHWGTPQIVYPHSVPGGTYFIDAFDMHYDPSNAWLDLVFRNGWVEPATLTHLYSTNRGGTWSAPATVQSLPGLTSTTPRLAWNSLSGPLLTYVDRPQWEQATLSTRRWNLSFQPPVTAASYRFDDASLPGTFTDFGIGNAPTLAVDWTIYRWQDTIYLAWLASCGFPTWPMPSGTTFAQVEPNDTPGQANAPPANTGWIDGQISPATEADCVLLHLNAQQRLVVRPTSMTSGGDPNADPTLTIEVIAPDGTHGLGMNQLPKSRMATTAALYTAPAAGNYYLRITGDNVAAYEISLSYSTFANPGLDRRDIWFSVSTNGGNTWSTPSLLGFEQPGYDVANPTLVVGNDGRAYLFWQDWSEADPFGATMTVRVTRSSNAGQSWEAPHTLTTMPSDWQEVSPLGSGFEVGWRLGAATTPPVRIDFSRTPSDRARLSPDKTSIGARAFAELPEDRMYVAWSDGRRGEGDIFTTSFPTGFEVDYRTTDTVATPGEYLGLRMALVNKNTVFPQWIDTFTPTCQRNWSSFYGSMTFAPGQSASTAPYVVHVPDTAATGTVFFQGGIDVGPESYGINTFIHVQPTVGVAERGASLALRAPSPNPASSYTNLGFTLPATTEVVLEIFDLRGARVRRLVSGRREAGSQSMGWDLRDDSGQRVANGVYLSRLRVGAWIRTCRVAVLH
jgi:FlgD Ig-like domain